MTAIRHRIRALLVPDADEQRFVASAPVVAVREIFRRFWPDARPYRKQIALGLLFLLLVPAIEAAEIWMFKLVVDDVLVPQELGPLLYIALAYVDLSLARPRGRMRAGIGTWYYIAPEQARGGDVGPAADAWGIAGVLYEAATGIAPFGEEDDEDIEFASLARPAHPVGRDRRLAPVLAQAIDAALLADAAARPTVAELGAACELAAGLPPAERRFGAVTPRR